MCSFLLPTAGRQEKRPTHTRAQIHPPSSSIKEDLHMRLRLSRRCHTVDILRNRVMETGYSSSSSSSSSRSSQLPAAKSRPPKKNLRNFHRPAWLWRGGNTIPWSLARSGDFERRPTGDPPFRRGVHAGPPCALLSREHDNTSAAEGDKKSLCVPKKKLQLRTDHRSYDTHHDVRWP